VRELREATAVDERVRIARDLHDGVVQTLAATALQLEALRPLLRRDPERAFSRVADLQDTLAGQQRELRAFIRALEPDAPGTPLDAQAGLSERLGEFAARLAREWGVAVRWRLRPEDARAEAAIAYDLLRIVSEATANAVRHGGARVVTLDIELDAEALRVTVEDDGRGFAFTGRLDHAALDARNLGPRSLLWRVTGRGGSLAVQSGGKGARLEIVLPRGKEVPA
jgi:signal transduction histidine kinase